VVKNVQKQANNNESEVKVIVHNKKLLMDVLMGDGDNSAVKKEQEPALKKKFPQAHQASGGISGIQRIKKPIEEKSYTAMNSKKIPEVAVS
jgi:hypothetical protein